MKEIHWNKSIKKAVRTKLFNGATPDEVKASFALMVDRAVPPEEQLRLAKLEIKRLRAKPNGKK